MIVIMSFSVIIIQWGSDWLAKSEFPRFVQMQQRNLNLDNLSEFGSVLICKHMPVLPSRQKGSKLSNNSLYSYVSPSEYRDQTPSSTLVPVQITVSIFRELARQPEPYKTT